MPELNMQPQASSDSKSSTGEGLRYNEGKLRWDLIPPELEEIVEIYTMGAKKYAPRNWEKGMSWMVCFASLMRHTWKWLRGEDLDEESGRPHMAHVAWNAIALVVYYRRQIGTDDRVKV